MYNIIAGRLTTIVSHIYVLTRINYVVYLYHYIYLKCIHLSAPDRRATQLQHLYNRIEDPGEATRHFHILVKIISDCTLLKKKLRHMTQQPDKSDC